MKNVLAYEKYAVAMPEANFAQYLIEAKAKRAPTKFAKCFRKQEEVDHDTKLALARSCLMQTYNSSKKQRHSMYCFEHWCCCRGCIIRMIEDVLHLVHIM